VGGLPELPLAEAGDAVHVVEGVDASARMPPLMTVVLSPF
jgi:hypothetical protein